MEHQLKKAAENLDQPVAGGRMVGMYEDMSSSEDYDDETILDEDEMEKRPEISLFAPDLVILQDKQSFKYLVTDNR